MFHKNRTSIALVAAILGAMVMAFNFGAVGQEAKPEENKARVNELLKERLAVLVQVAKLQRQMYERGEGPIDSALSAETDVLTAKLELATTRSERVAIRESLVEVTKQLQSIAKRLAEAGEGTQAGYLKAKALGLRAEVDLIREREND